MCACVCDVLLVIRDITNAFSQSLIKGCANLITCHWDQLPIGFNKDQLPIGFNGETIANWFSIGNNWDQLPIGFNRE